LFAEHTRILLFIRVANKKSYKNYSLISVAKVALQAIARNSDLEFVLYGICSNCIHALATDRRSLKFISRSNQMKKWATARNSCRKLTTPEDCGNRVYLLWKHEAS
jgi:enoyl-[acyl-carrier-protein] reductase (NADH)